MSEAILGAAAVALAVATTTLIVHTLTRRSAPAADGTGPVLARPHDEPSGGSVERAALPDPTVWRSAVVSELLTAEELLDRAEEQGYRERELVVLGNSTFLVRWRDRA
jgi:hypothetical protein